MGQELDDLRRSAHLCIFCGEPWYSHIRDKPWCSESAWKIFRGAQVRPDFRDILSQEAALSIVEDLKDELAKLGVDTSAFTLMGWNIEDQFDDQGNRLTPSGYEFPDYDDPEEMDPIPELTEEEKRIILECTTCKGTGREALYAERRRIFTTGSVKVRRRCDDCNGSGERW